MQERFNIRHASHNAPFAIERELLDVGRRPGEPYIGLENIVIFLYVARSHSAPYEIIVLDGRRTLARAFYGDIFRTQDTTFFNGPRGNKRFRQVFPVQKLSAGRIPYRFSNPYLGGAYSSDKLFKLIGFQAGFVIRSRQVSVERDVLFDDAGPKRNRCNRDRDPALVSGVPDRAPSRYLLEAREKRKVNVIVGRRVCTIAVQKHVIGLLFFKEFCNVLDL